MELSSTDDSSDTDEEESAKLREAVLGSSSLKLDSINTTLKNADAELLSKPSLRRKEQFDSSHDEQQLQIAPEVKAFVAKNLSDYIESNISIEHVGFGSVPLSPSRKQLGIRLFNDSVRFVDVGDEEQSQKLKIQKIKQRGQNSISSCSDSEEERHRLAEAAVSYDFIAENASPLQSQSKGKIVEEKNLSFSNIAKSNGNKTVEEDDSILKKRKKLRKKQKRSHKTLLFPHLFGWYVLLVVVGRLLQRVLLCCSCTGTLSRLEPTLTRLLIWLVQAKLPLLRRPLDALYIVCYAFSTCPHKLQRAIPSKKRE